MSFKIGDRVRVSDDPFWWSRGRREEGAVDDIAGWTGVVAEEPEVTTAVYDSIEAIFGTSPRTGNVNVRLDQDNDEVYLAPECLTKV